MAASNAPKPFGQTLVLVDGNDLTHSTVLQVTLTAKFTPENYSYNPSILLVNSLSSMGGRGSEMREMVPTAK